MSSREERARKCRQCARDRKDVVVSRGRQHVFVVTVRRLGRKLPKVRSSLTRKNLITGKTGKGRRGRGTERGGKGRTRAVARTIYKVNLVSFRACKGWVAWDWRDWRFDILVVPIDLGVSCQMERRKKRESA